MQITIFSVWMTVFWSSILILLFYVLRIKFILIDVCSVSGVIVLYLFCLIRMLLPVEFPWTKVIANTELYNKLYDAFYYKLNIGTGLYVYQILLVLWLTGTVGLLLRMLNQYMRIIRYFGSLDTTKDKIILGELSGISGNKIPDIVQTAAVSIPCCIGVLRKRILLPGKTYSKEELHYIILHEYLHLQNNDFLTKILINTICAFYWWNPFVYLLKKDLNQSMEMRCDTLATEGLSKQQRSDYLAVMLKEFKNDWKTLDDKKKSGILIHLFESQSEKLLERFRVVASDKKHIFRRGKLFAWFISGCMLIVSYSFVFQSKYDVSKIEIEVDQDTHEVDNENTYIIKQQDGSYILHGQNNDIPIEEENAKKLIQDGFIIIEGE